MKGRLVDSWCVIRYDVWQKEEEREGEQRGGMRRWRGSRYLHPCAYCGATGLEGIIHRNEGIGPLGMSGKVQHVLCPCID